MWATLVISKKLQEVNNHPMGDNSPDLVTLLLSAGRKQTARCKGTFEEGDYVTTGTGGEMLLLYFAEFLTAVAVVEPGFSSAISFSSARSFFWLQNIFSSNKSTPK
jgi:hypothetical protein